MPPTLSFIIAGRGYSDMTAQCLRSLAAHGGAHNAEVFLADCGCRNEEDLKGLGRDLFGQAFRLLPLPEQHSLAGARNAGAAMAQGDLLFFLDATSLFTPGWLPPLLEAVAARPDCGALSPLPLRPDEGAEPQRAVHAGLCLTPTHTLVRLYEGFPADHPFLAKARSSILLCASSLLVPRVIFEAEGGFDEKGTPNFEDADLCARLLHKGRGLLLEPAARITLREWPDEEGDVFAAKKIQAVSNAALRLRPDLEERLESDGCQLAVSGWGRFYPSNKGEVDRMLSARFIQTRDAGKNQEELLGLLEAALRAEPLWHEGYWRLAPLLESLGEAEQAYARRLTAARLRPDPENITALGLAAHATKGPQRAKHAEDFFESFTPSSDFLAHLLLTLERWCERKGMQSAAAKCREQRENGEHFRRVALLPFIRSLKEGGMLAGPSHEKPLYYLCLREMQKDARGAESESIRTKLAALSRRPLVSLLMPVYNPTPSFLEEALASVLAQSYDNWELCIADDASTDPAVHDILHRFAARDARIKIAWREANGHICAASNSALDLVTGEFTALMDHDDLLDEHALAHVAFALAANPQCRVLYSDEDKINAPGYYSSAYFKPAFDPDLLCGQNYFSHLCVYETALLREAGGFRPGFEGAQDHDLALRCTSLVEPSHITHLPRVLYHWRIHENSTAQSSESKSYASPAGIRAVTEHMERMNRAVQVEAHRRCPTHYRLCAPPPPTTRITLLAFCEELTRKVERWASVLLKKSERDGLALHVFHSGGEAPPDSETIRYSRLDWDAVRTVAQGHPGAVIGCLRPGITPFSPDWIDRMAAEALRPEVGAVGPRIWSQDRVLESAGLGITRKGHIFPEHAGLNYYKTTYFNQVHLLRSVAFVPGDCLFTRAELFDLFFSPSMRGFWPFEFCMRARAEGLRALCTPEADLYRMSGYAPQELPLAESETMRDVLSRRDIGGIALHPALTPVPGGYGLAALQPGAPAFCS